MGAIVQSIPQLLPAIFGGACPVLVARFREREENVKADVFATFIQLLQRVSRLGPAASAPS